MFNNNLRLWVSKLNCFKKSCNVDIRSSCFIVVFLSLFLSVASTAENLAYDKPSDTVPRALTELSKTFERKLYKVSDSVYLAVGYAVSNIAMIIGDDGLIIIDTAEDTDYAAKIMADFRTISDKPVKAVIHTHHHVDHYGGVAAYASKEAVEAGDVEIIAHKNFLRELNKEPGLLEPIISQRGAYWIGAFLELGPKGSVNLGCCPPPHLGPHSIYEPTITFDDFLDIEIAGVKLHLMHVPSETRDEIAVWYGKEKVIFTAEVIQGESYPNLHTLRGTHFRDPVKWYQSIDRMRAFPAEHMAPGHGRPVSGKDQVRNLLTNYRDGIQYMVDQTIRYMNKGYTPDELVELVKLPKHLAEEPRLQQVYGTVYASVRGLYSGYLGWFEGDPWKLDPLPLQERITNYVRLMGGREKILQESHKAIEQDQLTWAAELLSYLIRLDPNDMEARELKADALTQWAYTMPNSPWRHWGLSAAQELRGAHKAAWYDSFVDDRLLKRPALKLLEYMKIRLVAENALDTHQTLGFSIKDTGERVAIEIRKGVAELHAAIPQGTELIVELNQNKFARIATGQEKTSDVFSNAEVKIIKGSHKSVEQLLGHFELRQAKFPPIVLPANK